MKKLIVLLPGHLCLPINLDMTGFTAISKQSFQIKLHLFV